MNDKRRVALDLSERGHEQLIALKVATDAPTTSAVLRDALRLYQWAVDQQREGFTVGAYQEGPDDIQLREVMMPRGF